MTAPEGAAPADPRYALAFHEAEKSLAQQDSALGSLRDRAAGLLATATVLTTLAPAVGLIRLEPGAGEVLPRWLALAVVVVVVAIGGCALAVLTPRSGWVFTNNSRVLVEDWIGGRGATIDEMHRRLALYMRGHEEGNARKLARLYAWYRAGVALLVVQTGLLVAGFTVLAPT